jgi:hypothetical protein
MTDDYLQDEELGLLNHSSMLTTIQSILDAVTEQDQVFYLVDEKSQDEAQKLAVFCSWARYKKLCEEKTPAPRP